MSKQKVRLGQVKNNQDFQAEKETKEAVRHYQEIEKISKGRLNVS